MDLIESMPYFLRDLKIFFLSIELFIEGGLYHIRTIPLICSANQWAGTYIIRTSVMKELKLLLSPKKW